VSVTKLMVLCSGTEGMSVAGSASDINDECLLETSSQSWTWNSKSVADERTGLLLHVLTALLVVVRIC